MTLAFFTSLYFISNIDIEKNTLMDCNATKETLLIFDFDNTLIDKNTDAEIIKAQKLLGQCLTGKRYNLFCFSFTLR